MDGLRGSLGLHPTSEFIAVKRQKVDHFQVQGQEPAIARHIGVELYGGWM